MADLTSLVFPLSTLVQSKAASPFAGCASGNETRFSKKTVPLPTGFYLFSGRGRDCVDILKPFVFNWVSGAFCSRFPSFWWWFYLLSHVFSLGFPFYLQLATEASTRRSRCLRSSKY